jgi:hypothetical protein
MLPTELKHLKLIPTHKLWDNLASVPALPGIYMFFLRGGTQLLLATSYFEVGGGAPLSLRGREHLYTGAAAITLRERLHQHLRADVTSSSLSRSLLAVERARQAISKSGTPACRVKGERTLTKWLKENALVGIETTDDPYGREEELLSQFASPFNIAHRRDRPFSRVLSEWRCAMFPAAKPNRARRVRYA